MLQFRLRRGWSSTPTLSSPLTVVSSYRDVLTKARTWGSCLHESSNLGTRHCQWMVDILWNPHDIPGKVLPVLVVCPAHIEDTKDLSGGPEWFREIVTSMCAVLPDTALTQCHHFEGEDLWTEYDHWHNPVGVYWRNELGYLLLPDQAKIFFQGGMVTLSRKHINAHIVQSNACEWILSVHFNLFQHFVFYKRVICWQLSYWIVFIGIYIACNQLPDYGKEQDNVMRKLYVFHTRSLVEKNFEALAWMEKNALNVLLWIVKELSQNVALYW